MVEYTWSGQVPGSAVVRAVASAEGCDPRELDPLARSIDPDAIDALFDPPTEVSARERRLEFRYEGYRVAVTGDGRIELAEGDG